jgi:hypothetical protein
MISKVKTLSYETRARTFWALMVISAMALIIYIVAVLATVRHTVVRQNLQRQVSTLSTEVNNLEFTYIALQNEVTLDLAYAKGFKDVSNPLYISRSAAASLSFNAPRH